MIGHTGFLITARRLAPGAVLPAAQAPPLEVRLQRRRRRALDARAPSASGRRATRSCARRRARRARRPTAARFARRGRRGPPTSGRHRRRRRPVPHAGLSITRRTIAPAGCPGDPNDPDRSTPPTPGPLPRNEDPCARIPALVVDGRPARLPDGLLRPRPAPAATGCPPPGDAPRSSRRPATSARSPTSTCRRRSYTKKTEVSTLIQGDGQRARRRHPGRHRLHALQRHARGKSARQRLRRPDERPVDRRWPDASPRSSTRSTAPRWAPGVAVDRQGDATSPRRCNERRARTPNDDPTPSYVAVIDVKRAFLAQGRRRPPARRERPPRRRDRPRRRTRHHHPRGPRPDRRGSTPRPQGPRSHAHRRRHGLPVHGRHLEPAAPSPASPGRTANRDPVDLGDEQIPDDIRVGPRRGSRSARRSWSSLPPRSRPGRRRLRRLRLRRARRALTVTPRSDPFDGAVRAGREPVAVPSARTPRVPVEERLFSLVLALLATGLRPDARTRSCRPSRATARSTRVRRQRRPRATVRARQRRHPRTRRPPRDDRGARASGQQPDPALPHPARRLRAPRRHLVLLGGDRPADPRRDGVARGLALGRVPPRPPEAPVARRRGHASPSSATRRDSAPATPRSSRCARRSTAVRRRPVRLPQARRARPPRPTRRPGRPRPAPGSLAVSAIDRHGTARRRSCCRGSSARSS